MHLRLHSIRYKILLLVFATTALALTLAGTAMMWHELRAYRVALGNELGVQADILGLASAPALEFNDARVASENLALLKLKPEILSAAIYTSNGKLFASYSNPRHGKGEIHLPPLPGVDGLTQHSNHMSVFRRIVGQNEILGTVYIDARYDQARRLNDYVRILGLALLGSLVVCLLLSAWLQSSVTRSIISISDVARRVMEQRDFSLRAKKTTDDEIGYLVDVFNDMLAEIGRRASELQNSNTSLEHEITERRGVQAALADSERRYRLLVSTLTSVVWVSDALGHFVQEQPSWSAYTGQSRDLYLGSGWLDAVAPEDRLRLQAAWVGALQGGDGFELQLGLWHAASQRYRCCELRVVPLLEPDSGTVREWTGSFSDVDDRRVAEEEVRRLGQELEQRVLVRTAQLQEANKELESFSYSVSHDLRAPVRAVGGFAQMLWDRTSTRLDDEERRLLNVIRSENQRMGILIDDLLAFSRLGRQSLQPVAVDMRALASETLEALLKEHGGTAPSIHIGQLPAVTVDRVLFGQVWANLLSNALKFTGRTEYPLIEIDFVSDANEHVYYVRDNGAGFDPRHQAKLFGVFQRLHDHSEFSGTGVGLALVQRIVSRHGGRVWAEGRLQQGATFYFALPRK